MSSYDDKKYILEDGYSRLSHFHKSNKKSHEKYFLSNIYRQFVLTFTLVSITTLFRFFFRAIIFFLFSNIIEDYSPKWNSKKYYQTNKEKLQEGSQVYYRNLPEDEKIKKRNYANNRNKNMSDEEREKEKKNI